MGLLPSTSPDAYHGFRAGAGAAIPHTGRCAVVRIRSGRVCVPCNNGSQSRDISLRNSGS